MKRFILFLITILAVVGGIWFLTGRSRLKAPPAPKRISILVASDLQLAGVEGFKAGFKGAGWQEGRDFTLDLKNPKGDRELTAKFAAEIVAQSPDLIVAFSTSASRAVKDANREAQIPTVFVDVGNFKELGIENIQRPGGFMTGVVVDNVPVSAKRMEILKILLPNLKTVGILVNPKHVSYDEILEAHEEAAAKLGIRLKWYEVTKKEEVPPAMERLQKDRPDAFMTTSEAVISGNSDLIAPVLAKAKIPSIDFNVERGVLSGYFMVYGIPRFETGVAGARIVDKVLKGAKPGEIPVEFASALKFEINAALAEKMGLKIPEALLFQANKIYQ